MQMRLRPAFPGGILVAVAACALVLAACGGESGGAEVAADPGPADAIDVPPADAPADAPVDVADVPPDVPDLLPADVPDVPDLPDVFQDVELPPLPDLAALVNPFIGTLGYGNVVPGPSLPRGMVKLSPDTNVASGHVEGYQWSDARIQGFSHTHLEGPGGSSNGYSQILVTATTGPLKTKVEEYASTFSHDDEQASPGYYAVTLKDYDVRVELAAAARCGVHRYTFAQAGEARILVDLNQTRATALLGEAVLVGDTRVEGFGRYQVNPLVATGVSDLHPTTGEAKVYFSLEMDRPFLPTSGTFPSGQSVGAHLDIAPEAGDAVVVKVGISFLSVEQARKNLQSGCLDRSLEDLRAAAVEAWNRKLWRAEVTGGTDDQRRVFTTALYHTFLVPADSSEDGRLFSGWDEVGKVVDTPGWRFMTDDWCGWDTARVTHPLATILDPESREDVAKTYIHTYEASGWMAKQTWNALGDARCMTANFQFCTLADLYRKGYTGFDTAKAWEAMYKGATQDSENALQDVLCGYLDQGTPPDYVDLGYVSQQCDMDQSASMTLEYAFNDFCIAQFAEAIGKDAEAATFRQRSNNWRNVFDASLGFARPRNRDGTWVEPFSPTDYQKGFTEADSWKYTWHVNQDVCGLVEAMGGAAEFEAKLDAFFADGHFSMDNEPDFQVPWYYDFVGKASKTQALTRDLLATWFRNEPGGLPGNDDSGATSAWIVFAMIGLYPVAPSDPYYAITAPVFGKTVLRIDPERKAGIEFVIEAKDVSDANRYIQSATLNGATLDVPRIAHADIARGGTLTLQMGPQPSTWGKALCPPAP